MFIGSLPAARVGDQADCGGPRDVIVMGEPTVFVGDQMAARMGDPLDHGGVIVEGDPTVFIGASTQLSVMREAARRATPFVETCPQAYDAWHPGDDQLATMREGARRGAHFVEECPREAPPRRRVA